MALGSSYHRYTKLLDADPLTFFTKRLGGAGGVWLVSMNRLVLRLSGAEHEMHAYVIYCLKVLLCEELKNKSSQ
jgi:hypothetical protein